jgi:Platelet-activating factor acetylhydrolase, isoform II
MVQRIAKIGRPFPLVLFLHGLGSSPYDYSIQSEDLASHGYIIAAIKPVHDSLAVILSGGGVVPLMPTYGPIMRRARQRRQSDSTSNADVLPMTYSALRALLCR